MLVWTVTAPLVLFLWFALLRDNIRYVCVPVMIATFVFFVLIISMGLWVIIYSLWASSHWYLIFMHSINIAVLIYSIVIASCYRYWFASRDMLKTDDEEIDQA